MFQGSVQITAQQCLRLCKVQHESQHVMIHSDILLEIDLGLTDVRYFHSA